MKFLLYLKLFNACNSFYFVNISKRIYFNVPRNKLHNTARIRLLSTQSVKKDTNFGLFPTIFKMYNAFLSDKPSFLGERRYFFSHDLFYVAYNQTLVTI